MSKTITTIGPADHGRPMDLEEFAEAEGQDGRVYELSRGIVTVVEIPKKRHMLQVAAVRDQLQLYKSQNPGRIEVIASGQRVQARHRRFELGAAPRSRGVSDTAAEEEDDDSGSLGARLAKIVIEVVSPSSRNRDYEEKPEEYLRFERQGILGSSMPSIPSIDRAAAVAELDGSRPRSAPPADLIGPGCLPGLAFSIESVFKSAGLA